MKYLFLLFHEEGPEDIAWKQEEHSWSDGSMAEWIKFSEDAARVATQLGGEALQPSTTATVVSMRGGRLVVTDGPFIETKEQLAGFYVFDCPSREVALDIAARIPWAAPDGFVEVRPIVDFDGVAEG